MRVDRIQEYVTTATAIVIGAFMSYFFGLLAGEGSAGKILAVLGGLCFCGLIVGLRQNVWVLCLIFLPWNGALNLVPLHPALSEVVWVASLFAVFMLTAVKVIRFKPKFRAIDFWMWAMLLYLAITWLRHPTGGAIMHSDRVGGRPYLEIALAFCGYYVLNRGAIPVKWNAGTLAFFVLTSALGQGILLLVTHFVPSLASKLYSLYSGVDYTPPEMVQNNPGSDTPERMGFGPGLAMPLINWQVSRYRPLTLFLPGYPIRMMLFFFLLFLCLLGGFRSQMINIFAMMVISTGLRGGVWKMFRFASIGLLFAIFIVGSSYVVRLPSAVQRSLSFLPGHWDDAAIADARASSEWRFYMWKLMLSSNRYIENRWFGDGFGFSQRQLEIMNSNAGALQTQENFMIAGEVHSGPISAIRFVGYVGLVIYLILIIACAREGFFLCKRALRTRLGPLTLYFCAGAIWQPVVFCLIFGAYDHNVQATLIQIGLLKLFRNSLDAIDLEQTTVAPQPERRAARPFSSTRRPALAPMPQYP